MILLFIEIFENNLHCFKNEGNTLLDEDEISPPTLAFIKKIPIYGCHTIISEKSK